MHDVSHATHHGPPTTFIRKHIFSTDHKVIGKQYYALALVAVFVGMVLSWVMRIHLAWTAYPIPGLHLLSGTGAPGNTLNDTWILTGNNTTVTTNPAGLSIIADGATLSAPRSFNWAAGTSHTISVLSPQSGATGSRSAFGNWNDGGMQTHIVTASGAPTIDVANFAFLPESSAA